MAAISDDCSIQLTFGNAVILVTYTLIFCLSALGNSIVIVTILKRQQRSVRSITNLYLLNLSVADLLRSLICMPPTLLSELSQCWLLGPCMCRIAAYLQPVAVCASAYTLAVIAVERYYAICRPLQSRKWHSKRHAVSMISFVWLISFVGNSGSLIIFDAIPYKTAWNCRSIATLLADFFYQIYVTLILLIIPLAIMTVLYGNVIFTLKTGIRFDVNLSVSVNSLDCGNNVYDVDARRSGGNWLLDAMLTPIWNASQPFADVNKDGISSLKVPSISFSQARTSSFSVPTNGAKFPAKRTMSIFSASTVSFLWNSSGRKSAEMNSNHLLRSTHQEKILIAKKRVTRMLIMLVIAYVVCWTPSFVWWLLIKTIDLIDAHNIWNHSLNTLITILTYISTCTNPITYCFMNASFRKSVFSHCRCCRNVCFQQTHTPHRQLAMYPQRRRAQSAVPRLNTAQEEENDNDAGAACAEESSGGAPASYDAKGAPEVEIQLIGNEVMKSVHNKSFEDDETRMWAE